MDKLEEKNPQQVDSDQSDEETNQKQQNNKGDNNLEQPQKRLMPKKGEFRMRAHINPLSDTPFPYPPNPDYVNWKIHYPLYFGGNDEENQQIYTNTQEHPIEYPTREDDNLNGRIGRHVDFVDVGCGFGGLLMALSVHFPDNLSFGLEIRDKLCNFIGEKIRALRIENPGKYNNIAVSRQNAMRHLTNYFRKGQLAKLFFCFADPHFKASHHRRRIIGASFLTEYAYLLKKGGRIYSITDVLALHEWNVAHLEKHSLFKKVPEEDFEKDICVQLIREETEEGKKVARNGGSKFIAVYEKICDN